jgi:hypothetical protein
METHSSQGRSRVRLFAGALIVALIALLVVLARSPTLRSARVTPRKSEVPGGAREEMSVQASATKGGKSTASKPPQLKTEFAFTSNAFDAFIKSKEDPAVLFAREKRNGAWAGRFEQMISKRFEDAVKAAGFPTMKISTLECRQSSCQVEYDFSDQDVEHVKKSHLPHPEMLLKLNGMYWAATEAEGVLEAGTKHYEHDQGARQLPDGTFRKQKTLMFDQAEMDPDEFDEVSSQRFSHWRQSVRQELGR